MRHEPTSQPSWETKIVCECGERCENWMRFYRHRGDALLAEVERLRAEVDQLASEVAAHQVTDDYGRGHEHGTLAGMKARNVVPRSSLVQVNPFDKKDHPRGCWMQSGGPCDCSLRRQTFYVIREDTDA